MIDFYKILGVKQHATQAEITKAYRKLSAQHHPDRGGDSERMSEINRAYKVLSSPAQRARYDRGEGFVEAPRADPESTARSGLVTAFAQILQTCPPEMVDRVDLMAMLRKAIDDNERKAVTLQQQARQELRKVDRLRKRMKGGALFEQVFESMELGAKQAIRDADERIESLKLSREMIRGYTMEAVEEWVSLDAFGRTMDPIAAFLRNAGGPPLQPKPDR